MTDTYRVSKETAEFGAATADLSVQDLMAMLELQKAHEAARPVDPANRWTAEGVASYIDEARTAPDAGFYKALSAQLHRKTVEALADELIRAATNPQDELRLVTEEEVANRPAPQWWIPTMIQKGTVCVFAGEAGIGKTFSMIHMARCVATKTLWFGENVSQGTVLYVAAEGASAFGKRVRAWDDRHHTRPPAGSVNYLESGVNLSDEESVARLEALLDDLQPDLIILDTLSQLAAIENENDAAQMSKVFRVAKRLRDHKEGSTVILVHHTNKSERGGVRGTSVIRSNADTVIVAKSGGAGFYLSTEISADGKQKDGAPVKLEGFYLDDHLGSAVVARDHSVQVDQDWVLVSALYEDGLPHSKTEMRKACGIEKADNTSAVYKKWDRKYKKWVETDKVLVPSDSDPKLMQLLTVHINK
ncbi:AAA family ATPase [Frigoribacterium sp. VKM Ac-2836]|uniref:AAA family ATPase n=1 Tax=Frigoribacterium sp. VKM Ac-2836 TaxID=2739014 RepID=UPI0015671782|nr:AAA family ATPase [Frigoribacterium sp. VKM Ac-2836]NRD25832.1 AAA family ATPase [Frigoribacterium sp. VKM Ac-2836]